MYAYDVDNAKIAEGTNTVFVIAGEVANANVSMKSTSSDDNSDDTDDSDETDSDYTLTSVAASLADSSKYVLTSEAPSFDLFTVTETWTSKTDSTTTKTVAGVSNDYTISFTENKVGSVPVTLTYKDKTTTATVNVTFKYEHAAPVISAQPSSTTIAAYTGSTTLSVQASGTLATVYSDSADSVDSSDSTSATALDTLSYQWYSVASSSTASADGTTSTAADGTAIEGATSASYKVSEIASDASYYCVVTSTPNTTYCTSTSALSTTSSTSKVTASQWKISLADSDGNTVTGLSLEGNTKYTVSASNEYDTESKATFTGTFSTGTLSITLGDDASSSFTTLVKLAGAEQTATLTATIGTATVATSTYTIPALLTYIVTFNGNGGATSENVETSTQTFTALIAAELSENTFVKSGYTFGGWAASSDATDATYTDKQSVTISADTTLYAIWVSPSTASITVTIGEHDINVTQTTDGVVTLTADSGYDSYSWNINDVVQTSDALTATPNVLTFTPVTGVTYDVFLTATKNSITYTADIQIQ